MVTRPSSRVRPGEIAVVLGGAALLAGSWVIVAAGGHVPPPEQWTFKVINGLPDAFWPVVWAPMQIGSVAGSLVAVGRVPCGRGHPRPPPGAPPAPLGGGGGGQ